MKSVLGIWKIFKGVAMIKTAEGWSLAGPQLPKYTVRKKLK